MAQRHEHLQRADENEKLARGLFKAGSPICTDWAITLLFYSALHWVDAYLVFTNRRPDNHYDRDTIIESNGSLADIFKPYRRLKDMSEQARYHIACYEQRDWESAHVLLGKVKEHIATKL